MRTRDEAARASVGGAAAAESVIAAVERALADPAVDLGSPSTWSAMLADVDARLAREGAGGETTAVVAAVLRERVIGASAGDSEAWVVASTAAHDVLTAGQQRKRRLGQGSAQPVAFARAALGGTLVVGSDGLFRYAPVAELRALALGVDLESAALSLVDLVRPARGDLADDVAVALVRSTSA